MPLTFPRCARSVPATAALLLLTLASTAVAQGTGRSLDIQPGARQNGLGAAGVALLGEPADAVWWNPAALGFARKISGQFTRAKLVPGLADVTYIHVSAAAPLGTICGVAVGFTQLDYGSAGLSEGESSPSYSIGVRALPELAVGATLKRISIEFPGITGDAFAADVGLLYHLARERWHCGAGLTYQNFGSRVDFGVLGSNPLSRNYKAGASAGASLPLDTDHVIAVVGVLDYNRSDVTPEFRTWNGGLEASLSHADLVQIAGRLGYYHDRLGDVRDFTGGFGVRIAMLAVDGAWIPQARDANLDAVFKWTAGAHFALNSPQATGN